MTRRLLLLLTLLSGGCGGDGVAPPTPGTLSLRLTTPNVNDGALVIVLSGGPVSAVHAAAGLEVVRQSDAAGNHILLIGDVTEGVVATFDVPDISRATAYVAVVEQVADRNSFSLLDAAPYRIAVVQAP